MGRDTVLRFALLYHTFATFLLGEMMPHSKARVSVVSVFLY